MISILKRPGIICLAFFTITLANSPFQSYEAAVRCSGQGDSAIISRTDISGVNTLDQAFAITGSPSATAIFNGSVDLDINIDVNSFAHGRVTKTSNWVWRVQSTKKDNLTGFITANYQFNGLIPGDNKICSSPSSCIDVISILPVNSETKRFGNNNDPNNNIQRAQEAIRFTMDLSGALESGVYTGQLQIKLSNGTNATGLGNADLMCDRVKIK